MKTISKADFTKDVNDGLKKEQLMEKYEISASDVAKGLKQLGLKIKRTRKPKFEFVD